MRGCASLSRTAVRPAGRDSALLVRRWPALGIVFHQTCAYPQQSLCTAARLSGALSNRLTQVILPQPAPTPKPPHSPICAPALPQSSEFQSPSAASAASHSDCPPAASHAASVGLLSHPAELSR